MTLLIACLLIYHYDLAWWWYAVAGVIWLGHLAVNQVILSLIDNS